MKESSLPGRLALAALLAVSRVAHALHVHDPNRASWRVLDGCLLVAAPVVGAWVVGNGGDRRQAATVGFLILLAELGIGVVGF